MKSIVLLTICALVSYAYAIHNGEVVKPNSIPYQVLLLVYRDGKISKCGGSLVKADRVLTAAHCLKDRDYVEVFVGAHKLHDRREKSRQTQKVEPSALFPHPLWEPGNGYDVGIVKLPIPFELNDDVALVKLPYGLEDKDLVGDIAKISGWGEIDDEHDHVGPLREVENPIISNKECEKHIKIDAGNICMSGEGGRRTCSGDSGGPLVIKYNGETVQVGLTSKGEGGCSGVHPSVFTRVTYYLNDFIKDNLA
ncbi:brachyurin-like [Chironomus tepperi]|uniref:brachyurin-like n=1 Tax=Chironomus tepperi TaxID=113505 RepID=UPI00391F360B